MRLCILDSRIEPGPTNLSMPSEAVFVRAAPPSDETERLRVLERYSIMDTPGEAVFDSLTALGAFSFDAPLCFIALMGEHEQYFKSAYGTEMRHAQREYSFCSFALLQSDPLVVLDASRDLRFMSNPQVQAGPKIRFYAGACLFSRDGYKLGTFCIFDTVARKRFGQGEMDALRHFALLASHAIEVRLLPLRMEQAEREVREAVRHTTQILESTTDDVFLLDKDWNFTFLNENAERHMAWGRKLIGTNFWEGFPHLLGSQIELNYRRAVRDQVPIVFGDYSSLMKAFIEINAVPSGEGLAVFFRDVTPQRIANEALQQAEERYRLATQTTAEGIWDADWQTGEAFFSARWQEIVGFPAVDFTGQLAHFIERIHPKDISQMQQNWRTMDAQESTEFQNEYRIRHEDGSWHWILSHGTTVRDPTGKALRRLGAIRDITDKKTLDPLSGLLNRASLLDSIEQRMEKGEVERNTGAGERGTFALLVISLDKFKRINDSFGQRRGDEVLIEMARRIEATLFQFGECVAARIRGAEFAVMVGRITGVEDAITCANLLSVELGKTIKSPSEQITISASIGVAMGDPAYTDPAKMLEDAIVASNQANDGVWGHCVVFESQMRERTKRRVQLEVDFREALSGGQFRLHYQPKVLLSSGEITGFEALLRWAHPIRGFIPPSEFIPYAEESGLIAMIGDWTLHEGVRQLMQWKKAGLLTAGMTMAVNLSTKQFEKPDLVDDILRCLREEGAPEDCLILELTESALIGNISHAEESLKSLNAAGIKIDMDDFGTGYSSLSYLHSLPFHALKIDQSFTRKLENSMECVAIARSIIQLGQWLNMEVVAEGIETKEQRDLLVSLGCLYGQGYFYSKALAPEEIQEMLRSGRPLDEVFELVPGAGIAV